MREIVIVGAGDHAAVVAETARLAGWNVLGHLAPQGGDTAFLGQYLGSDATILDNPMAFPTAQFALGVGFVDRNSQLMFSRIAHKLLDAGRPLAKIIHPSATVSPSAKIADGVFLAANTVVGTRANIETATILNTGSIIDHDCIVASCVHVGVAARLCGRVRVGTGSLVGAGSVIRQAIEVGNNAIIGAGSVVVKPVSDNSTVFGAPASLQTEHLV